MDPQERLTLMLQLEAANRSGRVSGFPPGPYDRQSWEGQDYELFIEPVGANKNWLAVIWREAKDD